MSDIVDKLRKETVLSEADLTEAADRIEQLERENAELRSELASARSKARREMAEEAAKIDVPFHKILGEAMLDSPHKTVERYRDAIRRLAEREGTE